MFDLGIHNVEAIRLEDHCGLKDGRKAFRLMVTTSPRRWTGNFKPETQEITLYVEASAVAKVERILAAVSAINAEPDVTAPAISEAAE